jgi:phosphatidylinositol kinase/protein kinase (PI-3  family)
MRKQFAIQSAASMFLTYMCCLHGRSPSRFQISRKTGGMYMSEILPGAHQTTPFGLTPVANRTATSAGSPIITSSEAVPFRLTPNMQHFITKTGVEGIVTAVLTALSKSLTLPEFDLSGTLTIFLRDEVSNQALEMQETELITKNRSSFGRVHTSKVLGLIHPALLWCTRMLRSSFDVQRQLVSSARTKTGYVQRSFTR